MISAGKIDRKWYFDCLNNLNHEEIGECFLKVANTLDCVIYDDLYVWDGHCWLSQKEIDEICKRVDMVSKAK